MSWNFLISNWLPPKNRERAPEAEVLERDPIQITAFNTGMYQRW